MVHQDDTTVRKTVDTLAVFPQAEIQLHVLFVDVNATTVTGRIHIHAVTIPELLTDVEFNVRCSILLLLIANELRFKR